MLREGSHCGFLLVWISSWTRRNVVISTLRQHGNLRYTQHDASNQPFAFVAFGHLHKPIVAQLKRAQRISTITLIEGKFFLSCKERTATSCRWLLLSSIQAKSWKHSSIYAGHTSSEEDFSTIVDHAHAKWYQEAIPSYTTSKA